MQQKLKGLALLMRLDRPIGSYLLLWPTFWALWLANQGLPSVHHLLVFTAGVFVMRSAGCVINDYADREFDGHVKRTNQRPLVTGAVTEKEALSLFAGLLLVALGLVLTLGQATVLMSFVAVLLAASYPFCKRFTYLPQFVLGAAYSWAIPMAYTAVTGTTSLDTWLLFVANLSWTVAYDTKYAMVDRDDDLKIGVKSTAILFGRYDKLIVGLLQALTLGLLLWVGQRNGLGLAYLLGVAGMAGLFVYQQVLIRHRERDPCFKAFLNNHYAGLLVFIGLALHYLING